MEIPLEVVASDAVIDLRFHPYEERLCIIACFAFYTTKNSEICLCFVNYESLDISIGAVFLSTEILAGKAYNSDIVNEFFLQFIKSFVVRLG